jgi:hypothetical protein
MPQLHPNPAAAAAAAAQAPAAAVAAKRIRTATLAQELAIATEVVDGEIFVEVPTTHLSNLLPLSQQRHSPNQASRPYRFLSSKEFRMDARPSTGLLSPTISIPIRGHPVSLVPQCPSPSNKTGIVCLGNAFSKKQRMPRSKLAKLEILRQAREVEILLIGNQGKVTATMKLLVMVKMPTLAPPHFKTRLTLFWMHTCSKLQLMAGLLLLPLPAP